MTEELINNNKETFKFDADIQQLLSLIINTFYSNKDIFLRELVSNASDALDKVRFRSLTDSDTLSDESNLEIVLNVDNENRLLKLKDTGVGMTRDDLINNLGTIARSGTKKFMEALKNKADLTLIGQFGVGFYSAFLVADRVTVRSKAPNSEQYIWDSDANGEYTVVLDPVQDLTRGTEIILHIKEGMDHYLDHLNLKKIIKKHSNFINFPIKQAVTRSVEHEVTDDDTEEDEKEDDPDNLHETKVPDSPKNPTELKKKIVTKEVQEWDTLNMKEPIWRSSASDLTESNYNNFYKAISNDWDEPLAYKHISVEGATRFKAILFIPKRAPFDLFNAKKSAQSNIKLYVNKVLISENAEDMLPNYLTFMQGVIDSPDIPLNVSREMLQENEVMKVIKKHLIKKAIELINDVMGDPEKVKIFYPIYEKNIKLGVHEDEGNRERLLCLCRYLSSTVINSEEKIPVGLDDYISRAQEGQKEIYYITGEAYQNIHNSPFLEKVLTSGREVLYMIEPMDEYCMGVLRSYKDFTFVCMTREGFSLDKANANQIVETEEMKTFFNKITGVVGKSLDKVVVSERLILSPSVIVTTHNSWTSNMERLAKSQALVDPQKSVYMISKKILELNMNSPVIKKLMHMSTDKDQEPQFNDAILMLYEISLLTSGFPLNNSPYFTTRLHKLLALGLDITDLSRWENETLQSLQNDRKEAVEAPDKKSRKSKKKPVENKTEEASENKEDEVVENATVEVVDRIVNEIAEEKDMNSGNVKTESLPTEECIPKVL